MFQSGHHSTKTIENARKRLWIRPFRSANATLKVHRDNETNERQAEIAERGALRGMSVFIPFQFSWPSASYQWYKNRQNKNSHKRQWVKKQSKQLYESHSRFKFKKWSRSFISSRLRWSGRFISVCLPSDAQSSRSFTVDDTINSRSSTITWVLSTFPKRILSGCAFFLSSCQVYVRANSETF